MFKNLTASLFLISAFFSGFSHSASISGSVNVVIIEALNLTEEKVIDFGVLEANNGKCAMAASGALEASEGSTCSGSGQLGLIAINGTEDQAISIEVAANENEGAAINFKPVLHSDTDAVLVEGSAKARIGGELQFDNVSAGTYNLTYTVIVNYN